MGKWKVTSHNYKSVHARVCGMSGLKMHPKAHGVSSFFPSMAITWDIPHETASSPVVWTKPFITPWLYHPISITSYIPELYIEINRNTSFGAALWGNGRSRATIINQYMQGYVVCLVSKWGISIDLRQFFR